MNAFIVDTSKDGEAKRQPARAGSKELEEIIKLAKGPLVIGKVENSEEKITKAAATKAKGAELCEQRAKSMERNTGGVAANQADVGSKCLVRSASEA